MNDDLVEIVMNIHKFNQDLTALNIKYSETIEEKKKVINELLKRVTDLEFELEKQENKKQEINKFIEDRLLIDKNTGEYSLKYNFDSDHLKELYDLLNRK